MKQPAPSAFSLSLFLLNVNFSELILSASPLVSGDRMCLTSCPTGPSDKHLNVLTLIGNLHTAILYWFDLILLYFYFIFTALGIELRVWSLQGLYHLSHTTTPVLLVSFSFYLFFFVVLGLELRTSHSHLLGRCSTIWITPPTSAFCFFFKLVPQASIFLSLPLE
jgi:hypothetical protein